MKRKDNSICDNCGKGFYKRPSQKNHHGEIHRLGYGIATKSKYIFELESKPIG